MDTVEIGYLLAFLVVLLGVLLAGIFVADFRRRARDKRDRTSRLDEEQRTSAAREKVLRDKYGQ